MNFIKIPIISNLAHFHIPYSFKNQRTFNIPPPSTIVGILKILYNEDIDNFVFGYTIEYDGIFKDLTKTYKEVNRNTNNIEYMKTGIQKSDICCVEYLIEPKINIYTNIKEELRINKPLNLGKTDCLARVLLNQKQEINLINKEGQGYNQWTDLNVGYGQIKRITTETIFNRETDCYEQNYKLLRENEVFDYDKFYDEELGQNIFLWSFNKKREDRIECYVENH
ncbi:CRISPR-associated protein Cas5 [Hathewaya limosa]|uniref:CRISPR-associated protein Cas5t n=1 Tax=Hathewaya limosa TaxID=1536 RepID=A0ABU0JNW1_HATLI|nr:CRISPR-associated protein Cas5 [Hathewaya limosa]MDQ0478774.1 CRISPR-associated protein Cas5t [Hathewaya limosa]